MVANETDLLSWYECLLELWPQQTVQAGTMFMGSKVQTCIEWHILQRIERAVHDHGLKLVDLADLASASLQTPGMGKVGEFHLTSSKSKAHHSDKAVYRFNQVLGVWDGLKNRFWTKKYGPFDEPPLTWAPHHSPSATLFDFKKNSESPLSFGAFLIYFALSRAEKKSFFSSQNMGNIGLLSRKSVLSSLPIRKLAKKEFSLNGVEFNALSRQQQDYILRHVTMMARSTFSTYSRALLSGVPERHWAEKEAARLYRTVMKRLALAPVTEYPGTDELELDT